MTYFDQSRFDASQPILSGDVDRHPLRPTLALLTHGLADGGDHPEIWAAVADPAHRADAVELFWLIDAINERGDETGTAMQLIAAVIHALAGDRRDGMAMLANLAARDPRSPQIAGAALFVQSAGRA